MPYRFLIGTYTRPARLASGAVRAGHGAGILLAEWDPSSGHPACRPLARTPANPSFLARSADGRRVYAVRETGGSVPGPGFPSDPSGAVATFAAEGPLRRIALRSMGGADPCHISVDPEGSCLLVSNYTGGSVSLHPLDAAGNPTGRRRLLRLPSDGLGPNRARQEGPHPHAAVFSPDGRFVLVPDLGRDAVLVFRLDRTALRLREVGRYAAPPGSGPRHLAFHPTLPVAYLVHELDSTLSALRFDPAAGTLAPLRTLSTLPPGFSGSSTAADVRITPDGRFLYVSNRGADSLAAFALDADGLPRPVGSHPSGGRTPRSFAISGDGACLLAANQDGDSLVVFAIDPADGRLARRAEVAAGTPTHVLALQSIN